PDTGNNANFTDCHGSGRWARRAAKRTKKAQTSRRSRDVTYAERDDFALAVVARLCRAVETDHVPRCCAANSRAYASVSIASTSLSRRMALIRGKRRARPLACRVLGWISLK